LHATVSIGIASFVPTLRGTGTALLAAADGALYEAKRTGRNRLAVAAHAITESVEP
jgi:PleD family two-component response regulator